MIHRPALLALSAALLGCGSAAIAQQAAPASAAPALPAAPAPIRLSVSVQTKSGQPVTDLAQKDFILLDNKSPQSIRSFRVATPAGDPVRVILLIDAVNVPYPMVAYEREGVETFLKSNEGKLRYPTSIAVLTDQGIQIANGFTTNGLDLNDTLQQHTIGLREITRFSDWGRRERLDLCLKAFNQLVAYAGTQPGRKMIIWVSPGWPLVSGPWISLTTQDEQQLFSIVVDFSTRLRNSDVTLYSINPIGVTEPLEREDYYEVFLQGVTKASQIQPGNLGVQVISIQSGGLAIESSNDIVGMIRQCLADADSWYELVYDPPPADKPNQYHHIEVKIDQPGLIARTRDGYYANPHLFTIHK